jgi:hypothetical protein
VPKEMLAIACEDEQPINHETDLKTRPSGEALSGMEKFSFRKSKKPLRSAARRRNLKETHHKRNPCDYCMNTMKETKNALSEAGFYP